MYFIFIICFIIAFFITVLIFSRIKYIEHNLTLLSALIGVIEVRDPNLEGHSLNVRNFSLLLYYHLPFSYQIQINPLKLQYAALFLDIGKLCIPSSIIEKCGKLGKDELDIIHYHPHLSANVLQNVKGFQKIAKWIKFHHERVDGRGYYKLKGDEIPLASRIMAVADTFSALVMERTYKPSLSYEDAIAELRLAAGSQLDRALVEYFCAISMRDIEKSMEEVKAQMQMYSLENCMSKKE